MRELAVRVVTKERTFNRKGREEKRKGRDEKHPCLCANKFSIEGRQRIF
jgi:hypothetical protein